MMGAAKGLRPDTPATTDWAKVGNQIQITASMVGMIGAIGSDIVAREGLKAQADALKHREFNATQNARQGEEAVAAVDRAAKSLFRQRSAEFGQYRDKQVGSAAARGVDVTSGSTQESVATTDIVKEQERFAINKNAVMQAGAIRMGIANQRGAALMARVGAGNLRRSASGISPIATGFNAAMQGIGQYAWNRAGNYGYRRGNNAYRQGSV
tara:strand:- start:1473 stop:2105 length:633 start_codon:yes stop_codon:yes gene_type:complete